MMNALKMNGMKKMFAVMVTVMMMFMVVAPMSYANGDVKQNAGSGASVFENNSPPSAIKAETLKSDSPIQKAGQFALGVIWIIMVVMFASRMMSMFQQQNYSQLIATVIMFGLAAWFVWNPSGFVELIGKIFGSAESVINETSTPTKQ